MYDGIRKLASVQKITNIRPIPSADKIVVCSVLGWDVVIEKDKFTEGQEVIYVEIDSIMPTHELFFFLEPRKYRIRTIKLKSQISQGIVFPKEILLNFGIKDLNKFKEGDNVTNIIGITKYEKNPDNVDPEKVIKHNKFVKYMMKFSWFRAGYWIIFPKKTKGNWPEFLIKSDEERLASCPSIMYKNEGEEFYYSEKLDGMSSTFFYNNKLDKKRFGLFPIDKGKGYGVCSRNLRLLYEDNREWWTISKKYSIEAKLRQYFKDTGKSIAIQMETIGIGCNGNKYKLNHIEAWCFSVFDIDLQKYLSYNEKICICKSLDIPVIEKIDNFIMKDKDIKWFTELSKIKSFINKSVMAEGIVCRKTNNDNISFKMINPLFLLKYDE